jgi:hypothetical protein
MRIGNDQGSGIVEPLLFGEQVAPAGKTERDLAQSPAIEDVALKRPIRRRIFSAGYRTGCHNHQAQGANQAAPGSSTAHAAADRPSRGGI